jgi:hypothetical protein
MVLVLCSLPHDDKDIDSIALDAMGRELNTTHTVLRRNTGTLLTCLTVVAHVCRSCTPGSRKSLQDLTSQCMSRNHGYARPPCRVPEWSSLTVNRNGQFWLLAQSDLAMPTL